MFDCSRIAANASLPDYVSIVMSSEHLAYFVTVQVWLPYTGRTNWLSGGSSYSGEPPALGLGLVVQLAAAIAFAALAAHFWAPNF